MKKYLTRRDIMELLCISAAQFEWAISQLNIVGVIELNQRLFTIQDMIDIYDFRKKMNEKKQVDYATLESKINIKTQLL